MSSLLLLFALGAGALESPPPYGVLLLAHGGNDEWNREILEVRRTLGGKIPVEVAFGMADPREISAAVGRLEAARAGRIVAVPLFINSSSEVMDQTRYVLGLAEKPSETLLKSMRAGGHGTGHPHAVSSQRVEVNVALILTPALDDHPLVSEVLSERARTLSKDPGREVVVLVGHGPVDDRANTSWERTLRNLASELRKRGGYRAVRGATLRDDAPPAVRERAVRELRRLISRSAVEGRVLVVPYLIARGGIEEKVPAALKGLKYSWDARTLMPHPAILRWVKESAAGGAKRDDMRRFR